MGTRGKSTNIREIYHQKALDLNATDSAPFVCVVVGSVHLHQACRQSVVCPGGFSEGMNR